jgi:hypothetical protein
LIRRTRISPGGFAISENGFPEFGTVRISELESFCGPLGLRIERDLHFMPKAPISHYREAARAAGCIVEDVTP